jgi:hypothetical protein
MVSCTPDIPSDRALHSTIVVTVRAPDQSFSTFKTFFVRPEIRELGETGDVGVVDSSDATRLLKETTDQMTGRGFTEVKSQDAADLGVEMAFLSSVQTGTTCYSWYDPYYWGYPGYSYYPYYGDCTTTAWKANTLITVIADLKSAKTASSTKLTLLGGDGGLGDGGIGIPMATDGGHRADSGSANSTKRLAGIWFSGIYGVTFEPNSTSSSLQDGVDGIDQAFAQSPYLATTR